jgi:hypothetical protein
MSQPSSGPPESETGVEVTTKFFPLAFLFYLCTPRIEIDDKVHVRSWGTHFFPLRPGRHTVRIYFPYLFMPECGANQVEVKVRPGEVTLVTYDMPAWMFAAGSLRVRPS